MIQLLREMQQCYAKFYPNTFRGFLLPYAWNYAPQVRLLKTIHSMLADIFLHLANLTNAKYKFSVSFCDRCRDSVLKHHPSSATSFSLLFVSYFSLHLLNCFSVTVNLCETVYIHSITATIELSSDTGMSRLGMYIVLRRYNEQ